MKMYIHIKIWSILLIVSIILPIVPSVSFAAGRAENLVKNGSFEDKWEGWETPYFNEQNSGTADITQDYKAAFNFNFLLNWWDWDAENNVAVDKGPVDWSTSLTQKGIRVERGKTYKLKFTASSTVKRPIALTMKETLGATGDSLELAFLMGQFTKEKYPELECTTDEITQIKHTIYLSDIKLIDSEAEEEEIQVPKILGVKDGEDYQAPVSIRVNYKKPYLLELKKDGSKIDYKEGTQIVESGKYNLVVTDKEDASIKEIIDFTLAFSIDSSKNWVVISNKATKKVMEAGGSLGTTLIQSDYAKRASQFFTIEKAEDGYIFLRSMTSGLVAAIASDGKLELVKETDNFNKQLWKVDGSVPQGYVRFINKESGQAIDVSNATKIEGQPLSMADKSSNDDEGQQNNDAQRWDIIDTIDAKEAIEGKKVDVSTQETWTRNAIVTPVVNGLNPAGAVTVEFYPLEGADSYTIYLDGKKETEITKEQLQKATVKDNYMITEDGTIKLFKAAYTTKVSKHIIFIQTNTGVKTKTIEFYISKKGACWGTLHRTSDMDISWYYNWSVEESPGTDKYLEFIPMLWGNFGDDWLNDHSNKKYGTILSFNEPDWSDQSNVPVTIKSATEWTERYNEANNTNIERPSSVEEAWQSFMDSGLRVGSPATALAPPICNGSITMNDIDGPDIWWYDFMDLMESNKSKNWDYDFVALHSYDGSCDAKNFLEMIDKTYELTKKPIWITEFGVAEWNENKQWKGGNAATEKKVRDFMEEVIKGLEEREFVERYAWFPFNPQDEYGGASGIFDYETGELTELGKLYKSLGVPEGYDSSKKGQGDTNNFDHNSNGNSSDNNNNSDSDNNGDNNNNNNGNDSNSSNNNNSNNSIKDDEYLRNLLQKYFASVNASNANKQYQERQIQEAIEKYLGEKKYQINNQKSSMNETLEKLEKAIYELMKAQERKKKGK